MPEYDAFGREIGEDTLGQWRQGSGARPPEPEPEPPRPAPDPRATPAPAPAVVTAGDPLGGTAAPAPRAPAPRIRRRGRRGGGKLVLLLVVGYLGFQLIGGLADQVRDVADTITVPSLAPPEPAAQPKGLGSGSLLRPAGFERALQDIRRRKIGRLEHLRVAPERIDARLITPRGTLVSVQVSATEGYRRFSESGPGFTATDTIAFDRLDPRTPGRLTRAAAERLGRPVATIDYLVPSRSEGKVTWGAYFKGGAIFLADARGRIIRRVS